MALGERKRDGGVNEGKRYVALDRAAGCTSRRVVSDAG